MMLEAATPGAPVVMDVPLTLPGDVAVSGRAWFRCRTTDNEPACWIDVPMRRPIEVRFLGHDTLVRGDRPVTMVLELKSHLREAADISAAAVLDGETLEPRTVRLAPGESAEASWTLAAEPAIDGRTIALSLTWPDGTTDLRRHLRVKPEEWVVADLFQQSYLAGQCQRGELEAPYDPAGTLAFVVPCREALGGTALNGLHMHPPYAGKTGYVFATYEVTLPEGRPRLDFALGFRSGSTTQDGCVFEVQVTHDARDTSVFKEQYRTLDAWAHRSADLSAFAGHRVRIKLIADAGPADNTHSDWALWGAPRVVMADPMVRLLVDED
jgi:hypothetical protein